MNFLLVIVLCIDLIVHIAVDQSLNSKHINDSSRSSIDKISSRTSLGKHSNSHVKKGSCRSRSNSNSLIKTSVKRDRTPAPRKVQGIL
uniref:Secreted protein n=1 Tax=Strongyloides venezuelensis TaxID=75913 RepID=A0A0K0G1Z1_STRVS